MLHPHSLLNSEGLAGMNQPSRTFQKGDEMSTLSDYFLKSPPHAPPYVVENMDTMRRFRLITLFGIDWMATPTACVAPVWMAVIGIVISVTARVGADTGERLLAGLVFGLLIAASIIIHQLGGAIAGKLVKAPLRRVIFTATLPYNGYDESRTYSSRVNVIRGLGEPAANLLLGAIMLVWYIAGLNSPFVFFLAILNLAFFVVAMAPLPTMHGGVVLKHLQAWK
jgi:hypothetical protein